MSVDRLPEPEVLLRRVRGLALLDRLVNSPGRLWGPHWYHTFSPYLPGRVHGTASFDNGAGDSYHLRFTDDGTVLWGFDHESPMSPWRCDPTAMWPGLLDGLPDALRVAVEHPPFSAQAVTFCFWHTADRGWRRGDLRYPLPESDQGAPDGSDWLLAPLLDPTHKVIEHFRDFFGLGESFDDEQAVRVLEGQSVSAGTLVALQRRKPWLEYAADMGFRVDDTAGRRADRTASP